MSTLVKVFWGALAVKLLVSAALPLTNDEAYYWVWSRHLQLSYYDHPPFVAWLFWLGDYVRFLPGSVRWPGVLLAHAGVGIWLKLLRPYLDEKQRLYWLGLTLLSPLAGGSALVLTPDLPLMFFYALSFWLFFLWRESPDARTSLAFGVAVGLGFTSKYMMVLFGLSLFPLAFLSADLRRALGRSWHWLALGVAVGTLPVSVWNFMHDFASLKFQAAHGLGRPWKPSWTLEYALLQVGLIFPTVLYWALRSRGRLPLVFHLLAWTPLLFFLATTSRGYVEGNWPIAAYPAIFALACAWIPRNSRALKFTLAFWGCVMGAAAFVVIVQPGWSREMKFREFHQFDAVIDAARELSPLYARSYQMAAKMTFEMGRPVYKLRGMNRRDFYDFLEESVPAGKTYFVAVEKGDSLPEEFTARGDRRARTLPVNDRYEIWEMKVP